MMITKLRLDIKSNEYMQNQGHNSQNRDLSLNNILVVQPEFRYSNWSLSYSVGNLHQRKSVKSVNKMSKSKLREKSTHPLALKSLNHTPTVINNSNNTQISYFKNQGISLDCLLYKFLS